VGETPAQRRRRVKKERRDSGTKKKHKGRSRRQQVKRYGQPGIAVLLVAALVGGVWYLAGSERREASARLGDLVITEASLGRDHVPSTTADPAPTSGPHLGPALCGVYFEPLSADEQIHSLEHGSVLFQYREGDVSESEIDQLEDLAREFGSHVTVAPNPQLPTPFVATAWTKRMELPRIDADLARDFAILFRERGPERVDCDV
jgi:hypothetical protein